jgi:CRISPR-associated protein Cas8b/Csh1 subtype I-B
MTDHVPTKAEVAGDGELTRTDVRRYRLQTFIEDRDSLRENGDRKAVFLTGVLVGMTSHHQTNTRGMNRTVIDQYPPTQMTFDRLERAWPELVEKTDVYAKDADWGGETLFPEVLDEQVEGLRHPDEWDLSLQDVRFFYALGVTFGKRAKSRAYDLHQQIEARHNDKKTAGAADAA